MGSLGHILILTLLSISGITCKCWHGKITIQGYGHDIIVQNRGGVRVAFGEVPRWSNQYIVFYNKTSIPGDTWSTYGNRYSVSQLFPDSYTYLNTSYLMASGYYGEGTSILGTGIALLPKYYGPNATTTSDVYMIGMNLKDSLLVDDSVCDGVIQYLSINRYVIYNNWRYAKYSMILLVSLCMGIIVYYSYPNRIATDRLFRSCFCILFGALYSILGLIFLSINVEFQAVEYVYYIAISIVYFGSFVRYVFRKVLQDKTVSFYHSKLTTGGSGLEALKNNTMEDRIHVNNALNVLVQTIPRSLTNSIIIWTVLILSTPGIYIISYDSLHTVPYDGFGTVVSIVKFLVPIITTCIPAILIFILSIIDYIRRDRNRKIGKYFGISEDPLLYRIEFISCLVVCLPTAILTFIIGNLDAVMPSYILTDRWYHLTFHALFYIAFDITYLFIISGVLSILISLRNRLIDRPDTMSTTMGLRSEKKKSRTEVVLDLMLKDKNGSYGFISNFAVRTDNYIPLGIRDWVLNIQAGNVDSDQMIKNLVLYYVNVPGISKILNGVLYPRGLGNCDSIVGYSDIQGLREDIIESMETNLFGRLIFDGINTTDEYQEFEIDNKSLILDEITKIRMVKLDLDIELDDAVSMSGEDMTGSVTSV